MCIAYSSGCFASWRFFSLCFLNFVQHQCRNSEIQYAIQKYKENNDWLSHFLEDCCEIDPSYEAKSGEVYNTYRSYCNQMGEYARSTTDFYTAIEAADFTRHKTKKGMLIRGFRLKSEFE